LLVVEKTLSAQAYIETTWALGHQLSQRSRANLADTTQAINTVFIIISMA
jgi:hypothetical protein